MKSTLESPLGVSLIDDRGRALDADVTELAEDDLIFEEVLDGWESVFQASANDDGDEPPVTRRGEAVWMDEVPTAKWPAVLPSWVERELESAKLSLRAAG